MSNAIEKSMVDHAKWQDEKIAELEESLNIERIINSELKAKTSRLEEVLQYSAKVVDTGAEINNELKLKLEKAIESLEILKSDRKFRDIEEVFFLINEALEQIK